MIIDGFVVGVVVGGIILIIAAIDLAIILSKKRK